MNVYHRISNHTIRIEGTKSRRVDEGNQYACNGAAMEHASSEALYHAGILTL